MLGLGLDLEIDSPGTRRRSNWNLVQTLDRPLSPWACSSGRERKLKRSARRNSEKPTSTFCPIYKTDNCMAINAVIIDRDRVTSPLGDDSAAQESGILTLELELGQMGKQK
ncbi:GD17189 [Drosophila simulans]|uniref:GD17189 n=1 Tax=Drosophila simulans TaxID=7240 RepID=B4R4Y1_DROSI|nr:GD17189 [Drosophila simulans]